MKKLKDILEAKKPTASDSSNDNLEVSHEDVKKAIKKTREDIMKAKDSANQDFYKRKLKALENKDE